MLLLALLACVHAPTIIAPSSKPLPERYVEVQPAGARLCRPVLFGVIPLAPRYTARELIAMAEAPSKADALVGVTVDASQYYWLLGTTRCDELRATAVRFP